MFQHIYRKFIEPFADDPDHKSRELVLNWLLFGLGSLLSLFFLNSLVGFLQNNKTYTLIAFLISSIIVCAIVSYLLFLRSKRYIQIIASLVLILFLYTAAVFLIYRWGIINIYGILLFAIIVVVAGILFRARYSLYSTLVIGVTLAFFEYAKGRHIVHPDFSPTAIKTSYFEVINFTAIFLIIALVSWLFNRQMEVSLHRAQKSEKELKYERDMLEVKVEERTRALQEAQIEKVQQVYKFAELGHLSTALFHDLANSLSSLTLDIESMRKKGKADFTKRIDDNIHYIDSVVQRVKSQIQGNNDVETFDALAVTKELVDILSYNARKARTHIELHADKNKPIAFTGNLTRFRQLIINLLSNAIEAYPPPTSETLAKDRPVLIKMSQEKGKIIIEVTDFGKGIQKATQSKVFDPFFTTKSAGSGIGLFIVRQVAEKDFSGKIKLTSNKKTGTTFTVIIPK